MGGKVQHSTMRKKVYPEAVVFDYDGTLAHLNIDFRAMGQGVEDLIIDHCIEFDGLKGSYILEKIDNAKEVICEKNPSGSVSFYHEAHEIVKKHEIRAAEKGRILPGVTNMLVRLRQRSIQVGIITRNCEEAVKMVFPSIEDHCDVFVPRDAVTRVKPHPDHLAEVLKKLAVNNPAQCFMVGDHVLDIETGKSMSMITVGVLTGKTTRKQFIDAGADFVLDDATQVFGQILEEKVL